MEIVETLSRTVEVESASAEESEWLVRDRYREGEIVLGGDDCVGRSIKVVAEEGEASCWDDVIKHKADLHIIDDGTGRAARDGTGRPEVGPYRCDAARAGREPYRWDAAHAGVRALPMEGVTRLRQPRPH